MFNHQKCPFCGSTVLDVTDVGDPGNFSVFCEEPTCRAVGPSAKSADDAVAQWNVRVAPSGVPLTPIPKAVVEPPTPPKVVTEEVETVTPAFKFAPADTTPALGDRGSQILATSVTAPRRKSGRTAKPVQLKACTCGNVPTCEYDSEQHDFFVYCPTCVVCGPGESTEQGAIKLWNDKLKRKRG